MSVTEKHRPMNSGVLLRKLREAKRLSVHEFGDMVDFSGQYIAMLEAGRRRGTASTWARLADGLGVPRSLLCGDRDD